MSNENGKTHFTCTAHELLADHIQEFDQFKARMEKSMEQTNGTFHAVASMHQDTRHLAQLPMIVSKLDLQTESLILVLKQNGAYIFYLFGGVILLFVVLFAILLLRDSTKDFHVGKDGFHMTQQGEPKP